MNEAISSTPGLHILPAYCYELPNFYLHAWPVAFGVEMWVLRAPSKLLPAAYACAFASTGPLITSMSPLKQHSSERLVPGLPLGTGSPTSSRPLTLLHLFSSYLLLPDVEHACLLCLSQHTTQDYVNSVRAHLIFCPSSVFDTSVSPYLEHNRCSRNMC